MRKVIRQGMLHRGILCTKLYLLSSRQVGYFTHVHIDIDDYIDIAIVKRLQNGTDFL